MRTSQPLFVLLLLPLLLLSACKGKESPSSPAGTTAESSAPVPSAPFEGIMYMTTTIPGAGSAETKLFISKLGFRSQSVTNMKGEQGNMKMSVLSRADNPNLVYMINETSGSCMEIDITKAKKATGQDPFENAVITNLGKETVNGFNCDHISITEPGKSEVIEMWVTKDVLDYFTYARMQSSRDNSMTTLGEKLKAQGLDGFPVKTLLKPSGVITELSKIERTTPDAALFKVPENCTKMEIPAAGPKGYSKEDIRKLQEMGRQMEQQSQKQ
jgi:hypothetical protein